jgi:hypothetical protein
MTSAQKRGTCERDGGRGRPKRPCSPHRPIWVGIFLIIGIVRPIRPKRKGSPVPGNKGEFRRAKQLKLPPVALVFYVITNT